MLEFDELQTVDLFVIDEFYKLAMDEDGDGDTDDRARLLNLAFFKLWRSGAEFVRDREGSKSAFP